MNLMAGSEAGMEVVRLFKAGEFEHAVERVHRCAVRLDDTAVRSVQAHFENELGQATRQDATTQIRRIRRCMRAFSSYCTGGFDPNRLLPETDLPEAYTGKILLLFIDGGIIHDRICLRSNDLNHRDILRNAEIEILDLGLPSTRVRELGGAWVQCEPGITRLWGGSDEFGPCDKQLTARLIETLYPGRTLLIED